MEKEAKIMKHFSHKHPLCPSEVQKEDKIICTACEQELSGSAYKCIKRKCEFLIHRSCFELPREVEHKSHPEHALTLLHSPSYASGMFWCDACDLFGSAFHYHCIKCEFDLHVGCASLPEKVQREDHEHVLDLLYSFPYKEEEYVFLCCDVCNGFLSEKKWLYHCQKCGYAVHSECATREEAAEEDEETDKQSQEEEVAHEEGLEETEAAEEPQEEEEEEGEKQKESQQEEEEKEEEEEHEESQEEEEEQGEKDEESQEDDDEEQEEEADRECTDEEYLNQLICQNAVLSLKLSNQQHRQRMRMMRQMAPTHHTVFPKFM